MADDMKVGIEFVFGSGSVDQLEKAFETALKNVVGGDFNKKDKDKKDKKSLGLLGDIFSRLLPLHYLKQIKPIADGIQLLIGLAGLGVMKLLDLLKWLGSFIGGLAVDVGEWFFSYAEKIWVWAFDVAGWFKEIASKAWTWALDVPELIKSFVIGEPFNIVKWVKKLLKGDKEKDESKGKPIEQSIKETLDYVTTGAYGVNQGTITESEYFPSYDNSLTLDDLNSQQSQSNTQNNAVFGQSIDAWGVANQSSAMRVGDKIVNIYGATTPEIIEQIKQSLGSDVSVNGVQ